MTIVAANYGLARRNLGAVSVIGPLRMDYPGAIIAVRQAATRAVALRRRGVRRVRRDPYEVLGVARDAGDGEIKKTFRRLARELHPDVNRHDPEAEEKFKEAAEAYEILSDAERRATYDRFGFEGLDSRGYASQAHGFGSFADIFDAFFGGDPFGAVVRTRRRRPRPGRRRRRWRSRSRSPTRRPRPRRRGVVRAGRHLRALPRQRRRAGHADRDLPDLRRRRAGARGHAGRRSASSCASRPARRAAATGGSPRSPAGVRRPRPARGAQDAPGGHPGGDRGRAAHPAGRPRPRGRARRAARRPVRPRARGRATSASCATAATS